MRSASLITARRHRAGHLEGHARPGSGRRGEVLASFLQSDIQGDRGAAHALLDETAAAKRGEAPQPAGVGNAFSIAIAGDGVMIRNALLDDAPAERYGLDELRRALEIWIAAIERARPTPAGCNPA